MTATILRRGRPTAEDSREKMAHVLAVARALFTEFGFRAVTMRDVAERAQVSTRTLYNRYADKLSLFVACLDSGAAVFPRIQYTADDDPEQILRHHAAAIVKALSSDTSLRLGMLVYREGVEFPELLRAAEINQHRHLVTPLANYLRESGLTVGDEQARAMLFIAMAIAEWQRRISFRRPLPNDEEIASHADLVAHLFLAGARVEPLREQDSAKQGR